MPPKKRGGRTVGSVKPKLGRPACKNQNTIPNTCTNLSYDILGETASGSNCTTNKKVTTLANNETQIKLSNEAVEADVVKEMQVADSLSDKPRMTRNCLKAHLKKENALDNAITTPSNVPVRAMWRQQNKDCPAVRKRKLVILNSVESDDLNVMSKRACKNKRTLNKNNTKIRKNIISKNTKKSKRKGINKKEPSAGGSQTVSKDQLSNFTRKVSDVRNKESFNFEVTISSEAAVAPLPAPSPSECPSWARDISSSSTVTCLTVRTGDIVSIDNKLPMVRLTDVCERLALRDHDCQANGQSDNERELNIGNGLESVSYNCLARCTSSGSRSVGSESCGEYQSGDDDIDQALEKLTIKFRNKDTGIIDCIGSDYTDESAALRNLRKRVCKALPEESEIIAHCRDLKNVLIGDFEDFVPVGGPRKTDRPNNAIERPLDEEFIKPQDGKQMMACDAANDKARFCPPEEASGSCDAVSGERANDDDDDALSLYAESITGLDSSRKTDSAPALPDPDEYIPRSINDNKQSETTTYRPSEINKQSENCPRSKVVKTVCEKQSADSTSTYRETPICNGDVSDAGPGRALAAPPAASLVAPPEPVRNGADWPVFIVDIYAQPKICQSSVFLGVCFFNIMMKCNRHHCQFRHEDMDPVTVAERLKRLNDDVQFIQEYMIIRKWAALRRKYGLLFVLEGIRRKLADVVLEMAIDFTKGGNRLKEKSLTEKVIEVIMLYMNTIDVSEYGAYLTYPVDERRMLCDIFIQTLAGTQNFSRFKTIFITLTHFINGIPRTFDFEVATSLLERVCILPHDEHTARAMVLILKRSSPVVMRNSMIDLFAQRLSASEHLYREFESLKKVAGERDKAWPAPQSQSAPLGGRRSFSPDTTGPECANIAMVQSSDRHFVESFTKFGEAHRRAMFGGVATYPRRPPGPRCGAMTSAALSRRGALLGPPPRPLFPFRGNRPY